MPAPVAIKVSASFAESVRAAAGAADRSLTGQIEHWAKLGRAAEEVMPAPVAAALKSSGGNLAAIEDETLRKRVLEALRSLREGRHYEGTRDYLFSLGQPLFENDPDDPEGVIQVFKDGRRVKGRMDGKQFVPAA